MSTSLARFQDAFVDALFSTPSSEMTELTRQPGFSVYRNTVLKGATDALVANFPTLERLVGGEWLKAAATLHARLSPPTDARLLHYGAGFPDFLNAFEHAREMPYLGNVARLDLLWTHVHCAEEQPGIDMNSLARVLPDELARLHLTPKAAARWLWFADQPVYTLWRLNREQHPMPDELNWQGEGALLTRKAGQVQWQPASASDCAFLDACSARLPLGSAAECALEIEPTLDLSALITRLISADVFTTSTAEHSF